MGWQPLGHVIVGNSTGGPFDVGKTLDPDTTEGLEAGSESGPVGVEFGTGSSDGRLRIALGCTQPFENPASIAHATTP
ncbi:MAG: hypothetical protein HONBIEJF_01078 [Fimbriimonadaceae bacterium]|nr:hypothetical protein [Fimbriimonadaceae bacterium]